MEKEELVNFLKDRLKISINKDICNQYNDYEYDECIKVSLYVVEDDYSETLITEDYLKLK